MNTIWDYLTTTNICGDLASANYKCDLADVVSKHFPKLHDIELSKLDNIGLTIDDIVNELECIYGSENIISNKDHPLYGQMSNQYNNSINNINTIMQCIN